MRRILIALCLFPAVFSCQKKKSDSNARPEKKVLVMTQAVKAEALPLQVPMVSVLEGRKQAQVYSRVEGKISFLGAEEGKRVRKGEILFRVDRSDPGESFLATPVLAPIAGWVGRWLVTSLGAQVTAQQPVVTIVDDEALVARVLLPTDEWLKVSEKTVVRVKAGEETRDGQVIGITRSAESLSSRGTVRVEIGNSNHSWKAGMVAVVTFDLDRRQRIILPASGLSITDQGTFVFIVTEGKAIRKPVKFQVIDNDRVEILEGLTEGAIVVIQGVNQLGDGVPVKIVEKAKES